MCWAVVSALLDFGGFALGQVVPGSKHARHISLAVLLDGSFLEYVGDTARYVVTVYVNSPYASIGGIPHVLPFGFLQMELERLRETRQLAALIIFGQLRAMRCSAS